MVYRIPDNGQSEKNRNLVKYAGPDSNHYMIFSKNTDLLKEEVHADIQLPLQMVKKSNGKTASRFG